MPRKKKVTTKKEVEKTVEDVVEEEVVEEKTEEVVEVVEEETEDVVEEVAIRVDYSDPSFGWSGDAWKSDPAAVEYWLLHLT